MNKRLQNEKVVIIAKFLVYFLYNYKYYKRVLYIKRKGVFIMKRIFSIGLVLFLSFMFVGVLPASAEMGNNDQKPEVELTDQQKQELDKLYLDLLETKKEIINKYVEYGVLTKEKADKKLNWLDEHYQKIKEHGYIPKHHHNKHKDDDDKNDND